MQSAHMVENAQISHTSGPFIASHSQLHTQLLAYSNLTRWLKDCETVRFGEVMQVKIKKFLCALAVECWTSFLGVYS